MRPGVFPLLVLGCFLLATAFATHAQRSAVSHKSVLVRHVAENQSCTANCQTKQAWITIPHAVGGLLKGGIGARQVHDTPIDGIPVFPRRATWTGPDEADLAREFDQHVQAAIVGYATAMTTWQSQYGLATATHDIVQRVTHRGRAKRVIVNVLTFDNGNYYYNGARVMPEDANAQAQILYVRAVPSSVTSGLPSTWNWPGAGTLAYELRGPTFAAGSGFTTTSVGGIYDEPFDYSGSPFDPDAKLACLVDKSRPGCGQAQPDVKSLLGNTDATYAVLDYHRRIKPSGVRYGAGYVPQMTARVTDRVATFACPSEPNGTYTQVFRYSMKVENRIDRFLVFSDGRYYQIQSFQDVVTPAEAAIAGSSLIARAGEYPNLGTRFLHHATGVFTDASAYAPNAVSLDPVRLDQAGSCCYPQGSYNETRDCSTVNSGWTGTFVRNWWYSVATCSWRYDDDTTTCRSGPPSPPPTCSLTQSAASTAPGSSFTLTWSSINASNAWLTQSVNGGSQTSVPCYPGTLNGSCAPAPWIEGQYLYRLDVSGAGGGNSCQVSHSVQCPAGTAWNGSACASIDVCDNIAGTQTSAPPGTVQSGTSCLCTGGRSWNSVTSACECPSGSSWNGSTCVALPTAPTCTLTQDASTTTSGQPFTLTWGSSNATSATLVKSINGAAWSSVPCYPGTLNGSCQPSPVIEGTHLFHFEATGPGGTATCEALHTVTAVPTVDVCDNIAGLQSSPPPGTVQSGTSCICTGGRTWTGASCDCTPPTIWNGFSCVQPPPTCTLTQGTTTTTPAAPFNLIWGSSNATSATLTKSVNGGAFGLVACYPGTLNGTCQPTPVVEGTHLFKFDAAGPGGSATCQVLHTVQALDVCDNIPGAQSTPPAGTVLSGTSCLCTDGRTWNSVSSSCECSSPRIWNGSSCVMPPPTCSLTQDVATTAPSAPFNLTWGSTNATSATLTKSVNGGPWGVVACYPGTLSGTCQPTPGTEGTHVFKFDVSSSSGADSCQITHFVVAPPPIDVCDNIAGVQSTPPAGTAQSGTSCFCTGGRNWNASTAQCECAAGTTWNGSTCNPIDMCDNIPGLQSTPPLGTYQSGSSCFCTGGRTWSDYSMQCECAWGTSWNGAYCGVIDVCDNIAGAQSTPPSGTFQSANSCLCFGGRNWNDATFQCECPWGTTWNGSWCGVVDVCDNIDGAQISPPFGTIQSGSSCLCTGDRNWSNSTMQCECPSGTAWNGSSCAPIDVCDNISGVQTSPPADTYQSGSSCLCTGGRNWNDTTGQCECPSGSTWNGSTCAVAPDEVDLSVSGYVTGGGRLYVSWPGASCTLDIFNSTCQMGRVRRNSSVTVTMSPEMTWSGPSTILYGVYSLSSNGSCDIQNSVVEGPISCSLWSGDGASLQIYAPRCTRETGWTECR